MSDENPVDETPAEDAPVEATTADDTTTDDTTTNDTTTDDTTTEVVPADEAAVDEAPADEAIAEEPKPRMELSQLKAVIEALVFASPDPLTPRMLNRLLNDEPKEEVQAALKSLQADYVDRGGLHMAEVAGGFQITTRPEYHEWVRRLFHERSSNKLSAASLETLSVIAYKQPVTAAEIGEIRSVNTSGVLSTLLERHLIKIVGRKNVIGRPFLYGTTKEFLIRFGLNDLNDLPKIEDMAQQLGFDAPAVLMERPVPEEMLPLEEGDVPDDQPE
jgi:segregation and condensation protein B